MMRITMSSDADCANSKHCFTPAASLKERTRWVNEADLFMCDGRAFALVDTVSSVYFMDCITGSLYALGECLTSNMGRTGFKRNKKAATELLMSFKRSQSDEL